MVLNGGLALLLRAGHTAHAATASLEGSAVYQTRLLPPPSAVLGGARAVEGDRFGSIGAGLALDAQRRFG